MRHRMYMYLRSPNSSVSVMNDTIAIAASKFLNIYQYRDSVWFSSKKLELNESGDSRTRTYVPSYWGICSTTFVVKLLQRLLLGVARWYSSVFCNSRVLISPAAVCI